VGALFEGFTTGAAAESQINTQSQIYDPPTGWGATATDTKKLQMIGANGVIKCQGQDSARASETTSDAHRTLMRQWSYDSTAPGPVAGAVVCQHQVSGINGCTWTANTAGLGSDDPENGSCPPSRRPPE
jgi:hypothetical protein